MFRPILDLAGAKTFGNFLRGASNVSIEEEKGHVTVTPMENRGPRGGFTFRPDKSETLRRPSPKTLGQAILAAFTRTD